MQELTNTIMQSTDIPLLAAFILGLLVALNLCQLSINISALSYILKKDCNIVAGISYATGRTVTYTLLGWILMCLLGGGHNINQFETIVSKTESILPYILIVLGVFMLYRTFRHHEHHDDNCHNSGLLIRRNGPLGNLILGMTLALAFCPESAIFYFGIMLPMSMQSEMGIAIPVLFAIGAGIPVIVLSQIMRTAFNSVQKITHSFKHFQQIINGITGVLFIIMAVLLLAE